ncbi:MAG: small multi-drug export protein [Fibrobacteres bacterium]|nr:small multi-drug export protein [Fibrobacterota bacterium]
MEQTGHWRDIIRSTEGRLIIFSLILLAILAAFFFILFRLPGDIHLIGLTFNEKLGEILTASFFMNLVGGRAPGIAVIAYFELPLWLNVVYNMYVETLIVAFKYSVIVLSLKHYIRIRWLDRMVLHMETKIHHNENKVKKYGWLGLMVFSMLPLPFTGPVLASVMGGYFLKFSLPQNFASVMIGTLLSVVVYSAFFDFFRVYLGMIQVIVVFVLLILIVFYRQPIISFFKKMHHFIKTRHHD